MKKVVDQGVKAGAVSSELVSRDDYDGQLRSFEEGLLKFVEQHGLPCNGILVPVTERLAVFRNIEKVLEQLPEEQRARSVYVSKFIAAAAAGLFDAALNYLWDQTVSELRQRVAVYDLAYFFEIAVQDPDRRKRLRTEEDLSRVEDSELIRAANKIGLVSELGFRHLDYIRYMRNWASAAHPNQNEITGLQVISWLEICLREVIALPMSMATVEIGKLLTNIKANKLAAADAPKIGSFFAGLPADRTDTLSAGFLGLYCQADTPSHVRDNIRLLLPRLWPLTSEEQRRRFGVRYAQYVANNDEGPARHARELLDLVDAASYIPEGLRAAEVDTAIQNLLNAHREFNNFYNEPVFAQQLRALIGDVGTIPAQLEERYVTALVEVFITNGNGIARNAEPIYAELVMRFTAQQAFIAVKSFTDPTIASRLQFSLCQQKFRDLVGAIESKITAPAARGLVDAVKNFSGPLERMRDEANIKRHLASLTKIMGA